MRAARQDETDDDRRSRQRDGALPHATRKWPTPIQRPLPRIDALAGLLGQAIEDDGQEHDRDPRVEHRPDVVADQGAQRVPAETRRVDERGDHDHRDRQHDRLVQSERERGSRDGEVPPRQELAIGRAERTASLDRVRRHAPDAERRDADRRRHRVDERDDRRCSGTDAEEQHERRQVRERRHDLHHVEDRRDDRPGAIVPGYQDADRDADQERDDDRRGHGRQRLDPRVPQTEHADGEEPEGGPGGEPYPADRQTERAPRRSQAPASRSPSRELVRVVTSVWMTTRGTPNSSAKIGLLRLSRMKSRTPLSHRKNGRSPLGAVIVPWKRR